MTDTTPKSDDSQTPAATPEASAAPAPVRSKRSAFTKKLLSESGGVIDLAGRAMGAVAFAALFVKPETLPAPGAGVLFGLGLFAVILGIYLKAEAER